MITTSALSSLAWAALDAFNTLVVFYFLVLNVSCLVMSLLAIRWLRRNPVGSRSGQTGIDLADGDLPPVTLLAPAFDEEATCVESVRSLLSLRYPSFEIVVVNDGSSDRTLAKLRDAFELRPAVRAPVAGLQSRSIRAVLQSRMHPNLWVVDKVNGGKSDALNAGLNYCRTPLFCALDADSLLEPDALKRLAGAFVRDARTVGAGGLVRIANGCQIRSGVVEQVGIPKNRLARTQVLEYLRSFLCGRLGWAALDSTLIISGAFGMFRRSVVVDAGGYSTDTVGEDMELVVRLHRFCRERGRPYRITFLPDPVAWTECPETLATLGRQRDRWQRGLVESIWRHRVMLFNPRYGRIGLLAFPHYLLLEVIGPVIEGLGYLAFLIALLSGHASLPYVVAFLSVTIALGIAISLVAVAVEELGFKRYTRLGDLLRLLGTAITENVGYRQLSAYWRLRGMTSKCLGVTSWGTMERRGFQVTPAESA